MIPRNLEAINAAPTPSAHLNRVTMMTSRPDTRIVHSVASRLCEQEFYDASKHCYWTDRHRRLGHGARRHSGKGLYSEDRPGLCHPASRPARESRKLYFLF